MTSDASKSSAASSQEVNIDKQRIGSVYANALISVAEPKGEAEHVVDELGVLVDEILSRSPEFEATLASPRIPAEEKARLLDRVLGPHLSESTLTFLKVVADKGRLDCIRQIRRAAREELNRIRQRIAVLVTTAEPINDELRGRITESLQAKLKAEVDLECRVDSKIIGGLVVRVGDTVFDGSIANRLSRLKEETINKTVLQLRESTDRFAVSG